MLIVGLTGYAGSGKDTVADMIENTFAGQVWRYAFAKPVKLATKAIFGLSDEQMTDRVLKEQVIPQWGLSPREMMQRVGTESCRNVFGRDIWVKRAAAELACVEALLTVEQSNLCTGMVLVADSLPPTVFLITDVRFVNEANWIQSQGGIVVQVTRDSYKPKLNLGLHQSELEVNRIAVDRYINNSSTLDALQNSVTNSLIHHIQRLL